MAHLEKGLVPKTQRHGSYLLPPLLQLPVLTMANQQLMLISPHSGRRRSAQDYAAMILRAMPRETVDKAIRNLFCNYDLVNEFIILLLNDMTEVNSPYILYRVANSPPISDRPPPMFDFYSTAKFQPILRTSIVPDKIFRCYVDSYSCPSIPISARSPSKNPLPVRVQQALLSPLISNKRTLVYVWK